MNAKFAVQEEKLVITIDLKQNQGPSSTGRSLLVASTGGYQPVPGLPPEYKINLNLIRKYNAMSKTGNSPARTS